MTNDVRKLTEFFLSNRHTTHNNMHQKTRSMNEINDEQFTKIKPKDKVIRISDGAEMTVDTIEGSKLFCKANSIEGYKWYSKDEVKFDTSSNGVWGKDVTEEEKDMAKGLISKLMDNEVILLVKGKMIVYDTDSLSELNDYKVIYYK